ncbi:MAG: hypothetical protein ACPGOV_12470 [Magnetovibrionaceae bacterium]
MPYHFKAKYDNKAGHKALVGVRGGSGSFYYHYYSEQPTLEAALKAARNGCKQGKGDYTGPSGACRVLYLNAQYVGNLGADEIEKLVRESSSAPQAAGGDVGRPTGDAASVQPRPNHRVFKLNGEWANRSDNVQGTFTAEQNGGKGGIDLQLASVPCTGQWLWSKGKYNTTNPPQGTWSIACEDQTVASGTYISFKPGVGTVTGEDAKGNKLSLVFRPSVEN